MALAMILRHHATAEQEYVPIGLLRILIVMYRLLFNFPEVRSLNCQIEHIKNTAHFRCSLRQIAAIFMTTIVHM